MSNAQCSMEPCGNGTMGGGLGYCTLLFNPTAEQRSNGTTGHSPWAVGRNPDREEACRPLRIPEPYALNPGPKALREGQPFPAHGEWFTAGGLLGIAHRGFSPPARRPGFEPGTGGLENRCSIQLSYRRGKGHKLANGTPSCPPEASNPRGSKSGPRPLATFWPLGGRSGP